MEKVREQLIAKWPNDPVSAIEYTLNYFTAADLDGISRELGNGR